MNCSAGKQRLSSYLLSSALSQRHNSLNEYFSRIDFAEILQRGSLDQNNQTHALIFSKNSSTSGFMAHFRFSFVFWNTSLHNWPISAWNSSNWSLGPDKTFLFCKLGVGVTWGHLGSLGVKIQTFSNLDSLYIKMKLSVPWLQKSGFRGDPRSSDPESGGIWGHLGSKFKDFQT